MKYFVTSISEPSQGLPHFVSLGYVDSQVFVHYDSNSRREQPRVSWMEKVGKEDPQYWDRETQKEHGTEEAFRDNLETLRVRYNQSKEPPEVTMSSKTEMKDGMEMHVCRLDGFYPREINASWTRDGEVWLQDTHHGSVAPNADGTSHTTLSIQIDPKERGRYRCHVEHEGLPKPLDVALEGERLQGGKGWALWKAGGMWEGNLTLAVSRSTEDPARVSRRELLLLLFEPFCPFARLWGGGRREIHLCLRLRAEWLASEHHPAALWETGAQGPSGALLVPLQEGSFSCL
ncbi:patr class I histocompatibility antigen B-1 alpha chain-like [Crotalus adamanteus]|uniref:Patr class I histocompatibility antigen B-1 alpha chain-like n=1 Tax=Crotalus adamanteus TaxID=8729 RepID=A0AAW1BTY9_CROAD